MESASLTFAQEQRQLHATWPKIVRLLVAIVICIAFRSSIRPYYIPGAYSQIAYGKVFSVIFQQSNLLG